MKIDSVSDTYTITKTTPSAHYELLDSGDNEKLERFGAYVLRRPDPQALWQKHLPASAWSEAHLTFAQEGEKGHWFAREDNSVPLSWNCEIEGISFVVRPTAFKHVGVFPEHSDNWQFIRNTIANAGRKISVLNLFGYTGAATLAAASAGATVCHVDASKTAVTWARENAQASGLADAPIRWIVDDARKFIAREIKRGNFYDAIIMDPPAFGRGADGEVWKIERDFLSLLDLCKQVLSPTPLFVILNGYAAGYSSIAYKNNLSALVDISSGYIQYGDMAIEEKESGRLLPCGIYARWENSH